MDVYCQICGEAWNVASLHEDLGAEWYRKFINGEGCPLCGGKEPAGGPPQTAILAQGLASVVGDDMDALASYVEGFMDLFDV